MNTFRNIRELYQIRLEACKGFPEESLLQAEKRLKTTLPETFRKYYLEIGADETVNQSYNHLLPPGQLYYKGEYLCFCQKNQDVVTWAIRKGDLDNPNPPVWGDYGTDTAPDWYLETRTLSDFWLYIAIYNGVLGGLPYNANTMGNLQGDEYAIPKEAVAYIEEHLVPLTEMGFEGQRFFADKAFRVVLSLSVATEGEPQATALFVGTAHRELFDRLISDLEGLGVRWGYSSYDDEDS